MNALPQADRSPTQPNGWLSRLLTFLVARLRGQNSATARSLRHVETLSLGMKRQVVLIECDGERFLIAVAGDSVSSPVPLTQRFAAVRDEEQRA